MVKLVDTTDLKSVGRKVVPVRVRLWAQIKKYPRERIFFIFLIEVEMGDIAVLHDIGFAFQPDQAFVAGAGLAAAFN